MSEENILQTPVHHNTECHDRDRHKSKLSEMHQVRKGESEVRLPFFKGYKPKFYFKTDHERDEQRTFCYCPNCKHELVSCPDSFIEDTDLVRYQCAKYG